MADKFKMSNSTTGNYWKIENGKRVFYNKAGKKIDQSAFLKAEDAHIDNNGKLKGNKIYVKGSTSGRYWKIIDGKRHYFAADGTPMSEKDFFQQEGVQKNAKGQIVKNSRVNNTKIQKKSAKSIADDLKKATKGINDEAAIKTAIAKVDNPEELQELERLLEAEGYKADDMYSAVEKFLYKEMTGLTTDNSFDYLEETVQKWIQNGTLQGQAANKAQARMAARVIRDGGDGMGTDCDEVKRGIAMIKAPKPTGNAEVDKANARRVMAEVERIIKNAHGETLEEYLRGEMWDGEVKELKASLAANKAMSDENNVQAVVDLVIKAVNGAGTNEERLEQALKSITTREERIAVNKKLEEYCKQQGIKIDKKVGQDAIQAILYDELDKNMGTAVDHKQVRKYNEMLIKQGAYNKDEETQIRAQQAAKQVMEGDFENIMDAVENIEDPEVLKSMNNMLAANKFNNLDSLMSKNSLDKTEQNLVNANLASKNLLSDEKAAQVAYELLKEKDYNNRAAGFAAIRKDSVHKLVEEKLKKEGKSLEKVLADFNKEKAWRKDVSEKYDTAAFAGGLLTGWLAESRSDELRENTDMSDNLYLETDKGEEVPAEKKAAYDAALAKIEGDLNKLKEDYQAARDDEGLLSGFVNGVASIYNLGTTRDEIEARIEHDEETVRLLKLASEGKLTKMVDGKQVPVSFEEIFKERQSAVISANQASLSKLFGVDKPKAETNFDANKVTAVSKQGEQIAAMNIAKDLITDSWSELNSAIQSKNVDKLTAGITGTMKKLETMTGEKMNLDSFGYSMKDGVIVDKSGNAVSADKLTEVANKLKTCVSDTAKALYGKEIPANADNGDVSELINDGYEAKMEEFKAQYRAAYGQDATDEMIEDYLSTISTGVTIINIGAAIGAAILTAGAGSFAVFAAVGATSMALNTVEHATDANGLSVNEFMSDAEQALWDGALAAVGVKVGKYAEGFATSEKVLAKNAQFLSKIGVGEKTAEKAAKWVARVEAAGGEVSSDTIQSLAQMYCMEGEFDEESFVRALIMSAGFNTAGHFASALKGADVNAGKQADVDGVRTADSADGVKSADEGNAADAAAVNAALEGTVEPVKLKDHKLIVNGQEVEMPKTIEEAKKLHDDKNFILTDNNGYKIFYIKDTNGNDLVQIEFDKMDNFIIRYENTYDARGNQTSALQVGKNDKFGYNQHFIYNSENTPIYMYQKDANDNIIGGLDMQSGAALDAETVMKIVEEHGMTNIAARVELEGIKPQDKLLSEEFKSAMKDLEESVKSGKNNTVGELVESNPVFAQFKDEFAGLNEYKITFLDDATNTNLGQHSKKQIALNFDTLKENEEAFVNTLLHEAEHARQHKRFYEIQFKPKAERTEAENRFYKAYRDMIKANEARADFYKANKDAIDKFVKGEKLTAEEKAIVEQYKKLYDSYKSDALETEAREAGAKAADKYRANKEVAHGEKSETEQGTRGVQEDDSAGHQDGTVGSAARNENAEGTAGKETVDTPVKKADAETPKISAADEKYLTKPSESELPDNMEFADGNENVLLVYDGDTVVKTYEYAGNKLHKISEVADEGRVETTYTPTGYVETRITYDEAGNGYGFIAINNPKVNVGIQNILDENGNAIASNLFNAETNKPISTRVKSEDGGIIETKYNTDGKPVERNEFYENGSVKSETTIDPESEIVLTQKEYNQDGILTNEASFDTETNKGKGTMLDANGNPRSYEYDTQENFRWSDEEAAPVEDKKPSLILDPNAVTPNPNARFIVDPNEVTPNPNARFIVDPNEVTPNPDAKIIDPNAVEPNTTPLIKPETESPAPREVVKYDNAPEEKKSRIIIDPNAPTPMPGFKFIDPKAVTPNPNARFIVDPNEVAPNPNARFIVDPNEVTPNPDAKIIDPNAVEPNTTPLIKPEFESPAPREVVKYDDTPNTEVTKPKAEISTPNSANISDAATPVLNGNSLTVGDKTIELPTELREVNDLLKNKQFTIETNDKTLIVLLSDDGNTKLYIDHFEGSNTGHRFTIQTRPDNSVDWINSDQIDFWKQDGKERSWQVATYKHGENTKTELRHYNEKGEIIPDETPKTEAESGTPKTDEAETATPETEAESGTPKTEDAEAVTPDNPADTPVSKLPEKFESVTFEKGKMVINGQEFEIPKTAEEAEKLAAENSDNYKFNNRPDGSKELEIYDTNSNLIGKAYYQADGSVFCLREYPYQDGRQTGIIYRGADGNVTKSEEFIYNQDGIIAEFYKDANGNITGGYNCVNNKDLDQAAAKQLAAENGIQDGVIPGKAAGETPNAAAVGSAADTPVSKLPEKIESVRFENGKMVIDGQEFEMPKTAEEAEKLVTENGDNFSLRNNSGGSKDLFISNPNHKTIGIVKYDTDGKISGFREYTYQDGRQTDIIYKGADGNVISSTEFTYNNGGSRVTAWIFKDANGNIKDGYDWVNYKDLDQAAAKQLAAENGIQDGVIPGKAADETPNAAATEGAADTPVGETDKPASEGNKADNVDNANNGANAGETSNAGGETPAPNTDAAKTTSNVKDGKYKFGDKEIEIPKSLKDAETLANNNSNIKIYDDGNGKKELQFLDSNGKKVATASFDGKGRISQFTEFEGDNAVSRIEYNKQGEARRRYTNDGNGNWTKDKEFKADKHQYKLGPKAQAVVDKFKEAKEKADNLVNKFNEKITQRRVKRTTTKTDGNGNTVEIAYLSGKNDNKRIETVKNRNGKTIEVRRFDDKGRLRSRKVTTDQYNMNIEYDKKGNEVSFKKETKDSNGKVIKTETSKDKGDHSFGYTNADGDNVNVVFKDGEKVQTTTYKGNSDLIISEKRFIDNGTVETIYPNGKQPNQWNESTIIWKDNKGNIYRQSELAANGDIYNKLTYDDGTIIECIDSRKGSYAKVTKNGENPINYKYNFDKKLYEAIDENGNVTHRGKLYDGTWTEVDEYGDAVKTYKHKDSHKVRNTLVGTTVAGGIVVYGGMSTYEALSTPDADPAEEPATEEPAAEEPATEEPATEEPAAEEPATEEPATEEPATEEPATTPTTPTVPDGGSTPTTPTTPTVPDGGSTPTTPTTPTVPDGGSTPTTPTSPTVPQEDKLPMAGVVPPQVAPEHPVKLQPVTPQQQDDKPEDTPNNEPEEKTTIKNIVGGIDPVTAEKREIQAHERMQITEHINEAKNMEDIKLIQNEIRSFKKFQGRKNLRKALRAKRRLLKAQERGRSERVIERRENKLEKRIDKVEIDNKKYSLNKPENNKFNLEDNFFA